LGGGGRRGDDVDDQGLGVDRQADARGQLQVGGGDLGAGLDILDRDLDGLGNVQRVGLDGDGGGVLGDQGAGSRVADDGDGDVGGDLLTLLDDQQVGVLDVATDRVHDDRLGQRQLLLAVDHEVEHRVGAVLTQDRRERLGVERQVLGIGLVAVQHGGDVAVATGAAGRALAELGADCGFEKVGVGHDLIYSYGSSGLVNGGARNVG